MKIRQVQRPALLESLESRLLLSAAVRPMPPRVWVERNRVAVQVGPRVQSAPVMNAGQEPGKQKPTLLAHVAADAAAGAKPMAAQALAAPVAAQALMAPVASLVSGSATEVDLAGSGASGGAGTYSYQWYRGTSAGFVPSADNQIPGANGLTLADAAASGSGTGVQAGVPYFYVLAASDGQSTVYSNQVIGALSVPTAPLALGYQTGPVMLAYIGSSTWAINQGSGQVPGLIDGDLRSGYPAAQETTFNGAVGGTSTTAFLPGQPLSNAVKAAVQGFSGFKVLRLMIGSNDASAGRSAAAWTANMQAIINEALTWPVDVIVLEEIGVRLDGGNQTLDLIRQYNAARASLVGPKVVLGTAYTFENEVLHLSTLSPDRVHQTDAGQKEVAAGQATEVGALFTSPTFFDLTGDNVAASVGEDPTHALVQVTVSGTVVGQYAVGAVPALRFNLMGFNDGVTFDFSNGTPTWAGDMMVSGGSANKARLYVMGEGTDQDFSLTDARVGVSSGGGIAYQNVAEMHLVRGTFDYTGNLFSSFGMLQVGNQAVFNWN